MVKRLLTGLMGIYSVLLAQQACAAFQSYTLAAAEEEQAIPASEPSVQDSVSASANTADTLIINMLLAGSLNTPALPQLAHQQEIPQESILELHNKLTQLHGEHQRVLQMLYDANASRASLGNMILEHQATIAQLIRTQEDLRRKNQELEQENKRLKLNSQALQAYLPVVTPAVAPGQPPVSMASLSVPPFPPKAAPKQKQPGTKRKK